MGAQFVCGFDDRRLLIQAASVTLNGIDLLEVLDEDAPPGTPRQQTLIVRLFRPPPAGFDPARVSIEGGVRVTPIGIEWVQPATAVTAPGVSPAEAAFYAALPEAARSLVVRTSSNGDFSTYRLVIAKLPAPPPDFDPVLSQIDFSFKAECPTPFDCEDEPACVQPEPAPPVIDYLAKDYGSFRRVMLDRLAATAPDWRERNPADVGIAIVETLAYVADHLSYQQDAVATEAYLGTARRRVSVRRHARLLGYSVHEGTNARAWLTLTARDDDAVIRTVQGGQRTRFLSRCDAAATVAPEQLDALLLGQRRPEVFEPLHDVTLYTAHNEIAFYTWGRHECCLPRGATRATLIDPSGDRLRLRAGDVLVFEEIRGLREDGGRRQALAVDADPTRRHAVRLTRVTPEAEVDPVTSLRTPGAAQSDPLTGIDYVEIEWHAGDELPFALPVTFDSDGQSVALAAARGNIVLVDHGRQQPEEALPKVPADARRYRPPPLREAGVVHAAPYDHAEAADRDGPISAGETLAQDPHGAVSAVDVRELDGTTWLATPTLLDSDRFDRHFVVEIDEERRARLRFGDGINGRQPPPTAALTASYRTGDALAGNVGADSIVHAVTVSPSILAIRNPLPAVGGTAPETLREVRLAAPWGFRTQARAVTEADYAAAAERHPDVQRAVASRRWTGSWHTMFVTVDRRGGRPVDAVFVAELRHFLERFRLAAHDIAIEPPRMVPLDICLPICVHEGHRTADVRRALLQRLSSRVLSDGTLGYFHPDRFAFGQPLHLSALVDAAMKVDGVEWIDFDDATMRFQRWGALPAGELTAGVITPGRLEILQLDNEVNSPESGRLELVFLGGEA